MKSIKQKILDKKEQLELMMITGYVVLCNIDIVNAAAKPNTSEAKNLVKPWLDAGIVIIQWGAVGLGLIYVGRVGLNYLQATEEERQRINLWGNIKRGIIVVVIIESLVEIFKIFGLEQGS